MSIDKLRIGIVGVGFWAVWSHIPNLRKTGRAEVVAIARRNPERLAMAKEALNVAAAYTDWHELLDREKLDAVMVCTPHNAHREPTIAALERGLHVLVEKPIALSAHDAWAMIRAAEESKRILMVGYDSRTKAVWRAAKQALEAGAIGKIQQLNLVDAIDRIFFWDRNRPFSKALQQMLAAPDLVGTLLSDWLLEDNWRTVPDQMGGGMFADTSTHAIDLLLWLADTSATEVNTLLETAGWPVENYVGVQARLANAAFLSGTFSFAVPGGENPLYEYGHMTIIGDQGVLAAEMSSSSPEPSIWIESGGVRQKVEPGVDNTTPAEAFVATILDGAPNLAPASEAARVVTFTEAVYRSARERCPVRVEYIGDIRL